MDSRLRIQETSRGAITVSVPDAIGSGKYFETSRILVLIEPLNGGMFRSSIPDRAYRDGGDLRYIAGGDHRDLESAIRAALAAYEGARAIKTPASE